MSEMENIPELKFHNNEKKNLKNLRNLQENVIKGYVIYYITSVA